MERSPTAAAPLSAADTAPPATPVFSNGYRRYAMGVILTIATLNLVDRYVINILAEPIRNELNLLDWQIGALSGFAFALFYTFLGLPIARYAEVGHRPRIIATAVVVWSGFTALCGLAQSFTFLVLMRIGVGVGEAGCTPPSHSLVVDYAPPEKRASALALFGMGAPLGGMLGMAIGGLVADWLGWRAAFFVCAVPGILAGIVAALTLVEPRNRPDHPAALAHATPGVGWREALRILSAKPTFWPLGLGIALTAFISYGHGPFTASFFFRIHGPEVAATAASLGLEAAGFLGIVLGLMSGIGGITGVLLGGWLADRRALTDKRAYIDIPAWAALASIPVYTVALLAPSVPSALGLLVLYQILGALQMGPVFAAAMSIAPPRLRATASAIILFQVSLIGLGIGPVSVGALSDYLAIGQGMGAGEGIRWALIASTFVALFAFWLYRRASRTMIGDLEG